MDNNKKIVLGVVGGAAILGLAYYMFYANKASETPRASTDDISKLSEEDKALVKKVQDLGPLKLDKDGHINFDYLVKFSKLVTIEAIQRHRNEANKTKSARRELLKQGDQKKYFEMVMPVIEAQNTIQDEMLTLAGK